MLRERLRQMDLRITELADYLQISRPTMYKFIEMYDAGENTNIQYRVLKLFDFIMKNELAGKKTVINYILTHLVNVDEMGEDATLKVYKKIKKFISENADSKKIEFLDKCFIKNTYNEVLYYLLDIAQLVNKRNLTEEENNFLLPYTELIQRIKENKNGKSTKD